MSLFARGSRYEAVPQAVHVTADGRRIPYVLLRVIPHPSPDRAYLVQEGDRLDLVAHAFFRDPEQSWRIGDANLAMDPDDLVVVGRRLAIPLQGG